MAEGSDPKVTRRDALRLATAVGALGAGLGVTLTAAEGLAGPASFKEIQYKELQLKDAVAEKLVLPAGELGTVSLKIAYLKADGSTQLLHAFDLTSHFLKIEGPGAVNFTIQNSKGATDTTLLNRSIYIKQQKI
jgi:hypothetical protein